ncbi:MAG: isoleucine--tRNA ligase [Oscillospiraceae bacterium]|nr:isoleucine--tRNA ligase [Oscillospiraceae bacterium]
MADYNNTLNLPKTDFPMRANLPEREPVTMQKWHENRLYYKLQELNKAKQKYILHDGPPYANGDMHMGHALNRTLKDIIVKFKAMTGFYSPFVPGWDCHGLPIELRALKDLGIDNRKVGAAELRKYCRDFALSSLERQKSQMKRLGVWGDYDAPYVTIAPDYEARQIEIFGEMYKKGYIYKGLKPVHWCADCKTALAEAEIEYADDECLSIYVKFPVTDDKGKFKGIEKPHVLIWTTTTWTLPGNLAISLGPDYDYTFMKIEDEENSSYGESILVAKELAAKVAEACGIKKYSLIGEYKGEELDLIETSHPFLPRKSIVITGNHVTLDSGTGCVHTAPGFGVEDYEVCNSYKGMFDIIVPVDENGRMTADAGSNIAGKTTSEANGIIEADLKSKNLLLGGTRFSHSYPHCWRCHEPIIYRATDQWFCAVSMFRDATIEAVNQTEWIPGWGKERILNMVRDRSDWCISRQRRWGVPITVLYCKDCGATICNERTIKAISDLFRAESSDAWYTKEPSEFIPADVKCACGSGAERFDKELDIFDVWFDSGVSHAAVCEQREELGSPVDLYLEGSDQFRGWFQSSLLTSVAVYGRAPYKTVTMSGWILDGEGKEMHKSKGNVIPPEDIMNKYGADILRLWVASLDFHSDVKVSEDLLKQISETYRKIRNTARFILGNLGEFDPETDSIKPENLAELDKWALLCFNSLVEKVKNSYEKFDFYHAYHAINNFCVVDMSNFYLDIIKDRLYCEKTDGEARRSAQTAMFTILHGLTKLLAPILCYTAEEVWATLPHYKSDNLDSVVFNQMPTAIAGIEADEIFTAKWDKIRGIRDLVLAALEQKRNEKIIGKSLEAKVILTGGEDLTALLPELTASCIVSQVEYRKGGENLEVTVEKADGEKCSRCWIYATSVGQNAKHPELCARCSHVVET